MKLAIAFFAMATTCCYGQNTSVTATQSGQSPTNQSEVEFWRDPMCQTTYHLVGTHAEKAVPVILKALDQFSGETNAMIRRGIIQGALYRAACCTNFDFQAIIQKGTNDPSEIVRSKTTNMVERGRTRLREAKRIVAPVPSDTQASIMDHLYRQPVPLCDVPDKKMELSPPWKSEAPVSVDDPSNAGPMATGCASAQASRASQIGTVAA